MTLLGTGLFFGKAKWSPPAVNAAPSISTVTLNFDFRANSAPMGSNQALEFDVIPQNAAPQISTATLNFDLTTNSAPTGQNLTLVFAV